MKKEFRKETVAMPRGVEAAAAATRGRGMIRRIALGFACIIGLVVLYYCLIPALTQNGNPDSMYVFFDNGLSQYEGKDGRVVIAEVYETTDSEAKEVEMVLLSKVIDDNGALWSAVRAQLGSAVGDDGSITNVNPKNVYVSADPIAIGHYVKFTAWDSGTVFDTTSNYQKDSASREWGYDYRDFQWTSLLTPVNAADGACYYAPPQLMYNRYTAEVALSSGDEKSIVQMIYAQGDKKDGAYSKPEAEGSWVKPQNADNRTFYDAVFTMEGRFGSVTGVNNLGVTSQSQNGTTLEGSVKLGGNGDNGLSTANKQYLASATFFDYYSDWELAGKPLIDHELTYGYTDAEAENKLLYSFSAKAKKTEKVLSYNATEEETLVVGDPVAGTVVTYIFDDGTIPTGFAYVAGTAEYQGLEGGSNKVYGGSGKAMKIHNTERAVLAYTLAAGENDVKRTYNITFDALRSSSDTTSVYAELRIVNADDSTTNTTLKIDNPTVQGTDTGVWSKISIPNFERPYDAKSVQLVLWSGAGVSVDNFTVTPYDATITIGETAIGEKVAGTTIFANDEHGFVNVSTKEKSTFNISTKYDSRTDDDSYVLLAYSGAVGHYAFSASSEAEFYNASIWVMRNENEDTTATVWLYYKLNGTEYTVPLNTVTLPTSLKEDGTTEYLWTWVPLETGDFTVPKGATDLALRYSTNSNRAVRYDDFTLTSTTINGSSGTDADTGDHVLARGSGFTSCSPVMYIYSVQGYEPDEASYSNKELYYAEANIYVEQECDLVITAEHYDAYDYANNTVSGNVVKTEEVCTIHVPAKTWTYISTEKFDLPIPAVSTKLSISVKDNPNAKVFIDEFQFWRGYFNKNHSISFNEVITTVDFSNGTGGFVDNLPDDRIENSASKLDSLTVVDGTLFVDKKDKDATNTLDYYSALDNEDEGMAMIELAVAENQLYVASASVKNAKSPGSNKNYIVDFYAEYFDAEGAFLSSEILDGITVSGEATGEEAWHPFESEFQTPAGTATVRLGVYVHTGGTGGEQSYYLDDFVFEKKTVETEAAAVSSSFSEGTNRIAYAYQGHLFNNAISQYYIDALGDSETDKLVPLYFGSNSWMPGNGRYLAWNKDYTKRLFTDAQIAAGLIGEGDTYVINREELVGGAYLHPYSRQYWHTLYGFTTDSDNTPHGFSNSRAVEGLVYYDPETKQLKTVVDNVSEDDYIVAPYFNTEFLRGDNDAHAAYGSVYEDVDFSFAFNEDTGYYEYDSTRAWYATRLTQSTTGKYYMDYYNYDEIVKHAAEKPATGDQVTYTDSDLMGVKKADGSYTEATGSSQTLYQFYPFNSPDTNDRFATENLMFGMKLDIPFNMYTDTEKRNNSVFKFSGDDDVWVYVDGKPVLDIGGTHTAVGGFIDLKNGYSVVASSYSNNTGQASIDTKLTDPGQVRHHEIPTKSNKSGTDAGITIAEKAAFALLASLDEIYFGTSNSRKDIIDSEDLVAYLQANTNEEGLHATQWMSQDTGDAWNKTKKSVNFFDDTFVVADTSQTNGKISFQYRARLSGDGELLIDVKARNIKADTTSTEDKYNITDLDGDTQVNWADATFKLSTFTLNTTTQNVDLTEHTLNIYYLERGLNSSNFKLAFNFIPNAQREVAKVWADGNANHKSKDDYVDVELWRTEPVNADTSFVFPDNYALVRAVAHQSKYDSGNATSKFIEDNDEVTVQFNMNDSNVDSAATLTLNGMPLTLEAYRQLHASDLAMTIYLNDVPVSLNTTQTDAEDDDDGDRNTLDPGEFYNPSNADDAGFAIALDPYDDKGEYNYTAIKLHDNDENDPNKAVQSVVKVVFKAKTDGAVKNPDYNTWGFRTSNTWLVEAYGYNRNNNVEIAVTDQIVLSDLTQDYLTVSGEASVTLDASDMVIAVTNAVRKYDDNTNLYANNYFAYAVAPDMSLNVLYSYVKDRTINVSTGTWKGAFTGAEYTNQGDVTVAVNTKHTIELKGASDKDNIVYFVKCKNTEEDDDVGNGFECQSTLKAVIYSDPIPIGDTERLTWSDDPTVEGWKKTWDNIVESVTFGDTTYQYRYFIREVAASSSSHGKQLSDYQTLYYDSSGNLIPPTEITVTGDNPATKDVVETDYTSTMTLYSIDNMDATNTKGYVKIVNNPVTNAVIKKDWAVKEDGDKIPIVVTIYGEDSNSGTDDAVTIVDKILLSSANNFTATLEALPLYNPETNGTWTYYAAEDISARYTASYNATVQEKYLGETTVYVYPLNPPVEGETDALSLTITNQVEGFVLEVNKVDEDGTTPLQGAEFVLYEYDDTLKTWVVVTNTATNDEEDTTEGTNAEDAEAQANSEDDLAEGADSGDENTRVKVVGSTDTPLANSHLSAIKSIADDTVAKADADTEVVTPGVYYDFSQRTSEDSDSNKYKDYFTIQGCTNDNLTTLSSPIAYVDSTNKSLTKGLKMGSGQKITFTTNGAMFLTLVVGNNKDEDTLVITKADGTVVSTLDEIKKRPIHIVSLPEAGTYTISRTYGQPYLCYLDFSTYNKYDAENFAKALNSSTWFQDSSKEYITLADELVNLQLTAPGTGWGLEYAVDYGNGGWQKDPDYYTDAGSHWYHATIDNNVITGHIRYLAKAYQVTNDVRYKNSVIAGINCLLNAQYSNGGWPSVFEIATGDACPHDTYQAHITYNDSAMTKVMELLLEVRNQSGDFAGIVDSTLAGNAGTSVMKGVDCILATQIELDGELTAWCQQHDKSTLKPIRARAHELESISGGESVGIIDFLKKVQQDDKLYTDNSNYTKKEVDSSIHAAIKWLNTVAQRGYTYNKKAATGVSALAYTGNETDYLWARYYAIDSIPSTDPSSPMYGIKAYNAKGEEVTIAPNQPFFVERTDTTKETLAHDYISYRDGNYAITVFSEMSGMPEKQQKSYDWYGTWGKGYVTKTITSDMTQLLTTNDVASDYFYFATTGKGGETETLTYDGVTYTNGLKIGSTQEIIFTVKGDATLRTLVRMRYADTTGNLVLTPLNGDGTSQSKPVAIVADTTTESEYLLEYTLTSGTYSLKRDGAKEMLLYSLEIDYGSDTEEEPTETTTETTTEATTETTTETTTEAATEETPDSTETETNPNVPTGAMVYTTDANGRIIIGGLQAGQYRLKEVKAPLGYLPYTSDINFTVRSDTEGVIQTDSIGDFIPNEMVKIEWTDTEKLILTATIKNKHYAIIIPNTGGMGVYPVFIGGAVLIIVAGVLVSRKRNRRSD